MGSTSESEPEVKLLTDKCSAFAQRVQIALLEKRIPFESIYVPLPQKTALLVEINPIYRQVPVLIHKARTLSQSLVILEYLEDAFPDHTPLMPKDPYEKGKVRFWADFLHRGYSTFIETSMRLKPGSALKPAAFEGTVKFMRMVDAAMTSYSTEGPFFTGSEFGLLDAVLAPFTTSLVVVEKLDGFVGPGPSEIPRLHKWMKVIRARPSVISSIPPAEDHMSFVYKVFHGNPDLQLHLDELNAPQKYQHPRAKSSNSTVFSAHILVYES